MKKVYGFLLRINGDEGTQDVPPEPKDNGKPEGKQDDPNGKVDDDKQDLSALPESVQKMIKDLRTENAKYRTERNGLSSKLEKFEKGFKTMFGEEDDDVEPQVKIDALQGQYESLSTRNAILEIAIENGISGSENIEYFEFLMSKKLGSLQENEEMTEDDLADIISKLNVKSGGGKANTSTNDGGKGGKGPESKDEINQESFNKMTITEKSKLYQTKPELYNKLMRGFNL
jgi:cell division protein FtsB